MWGCHMPKTHRQQASSLCLVQTCHYMSVDFTQKPAFCVYTLPTWNVPYMVCAMHFILLISCRISADDRETLPYSKCPDVCTIFNLVFITSSFKTWLWKVKVAQSCPTLCNLMDYTDLGILQARILEWVAIPFSRGSSQPRDRTQVSHITDGLFTSWATKEGSGNFVLIWNTILCLWMTFLLYPRKPIGHV